MNIVVDEIVEVVARYYHITKEEIMNDRRKRVFSHPRQMAMYLAREYTTASTTFIGRKLGGKDHTTVLHAVHALPVRAKKWDYVYNDLAHFRLVFDEKRRLLGYDAAYDKAWATWAFIHRNVPLDRVEVRDGIVTVPLALRASGAEA